MERLKMKKHIDNLLNQVFDGNEDLSVVKTGIDDFLDELEKDSDKMKLFYDAAFFFIYYANPILCIDEKQSHRVTNVILVILFSLIEGTMQEIEYFDFAKFLDCKISDTKEGISCDKKKFLIELKKEYIKKYGCTEKVREFFDKYIPDKDKAFILEKFENGKYDNINKVIGKIYLMRSSFVHQLGFEKLFPTDVLLGIAKNESGKEELEFIETLHIKDFTAIVWKGIFRKFGFDEKKLNVL